MIVVEGPGFRLCRHHLQVTFVRASGPGGQNVNKLATKAVARLRLADLSDQDLDPSIRARLEASLSSRLTKDGSLVVASDRHRDREQNIRDVLKRLATIIAQAARPPKPRHPTTVPHHERRARRNAKLRRSQVKQRRRTILAPEE